MYRRQRGDRPAYVRPLGGAEFGWQRSWRPGSTAPEPLAAGRALDLDLSRTGIGDAGIAAIVESPHMTRLRRLALNGNRITEAGKRLLLAVPHFQKLPVLELRANG